MFRKNLSGWLNGLMGLLFLAGSAGCVHSEKKSSTNTASLPVIGALGKPWTPVAFNNDPAHFQFVVVSDRTGGVRPGVFESAIQKINLLQPEFVMSVGDLITGHTEDRKQIEVKRAV